MATRELQSPEQILRQLNRSGFDAASFCVKVAIMAKHYQVEQRERAVKMVLDHLDEYRSVYAACVAISPKVGVGVVSLRRWVVQAHVDGAQRPGATSAEQQLDQATLRGTTRDLKEANEILKAASIFFARELDPRHC